MDINWTNIIAILGGLVLPLVAILFKLFFQVKTHGGILPKLEKSHEDLRDEQTKINNELVKMTAEEKYLRRDVEIMKEDMKEGFKNTNDLQNEILRHLKNK
jgi:hypothetical protein